VFSYKTAASQYKYSILGDTADAVNTRQQAQKEQANILLHAFTSVLVAL
jgi:hypothetical protein